MQNQSSSLIKRRCYSLLVANLSLALSSFAWADCSYTITNNWGSGFTGEIKVTNHTNQTVYGWSVNWKDAATITNSWNATVSGSNPYTATALNWNSTLAPNASASFGFQGRGNASIAKVNGTLCGAAVSSSSKSSTPVMSSAAPSSTPASSSAPSSTATSSIVPSSKAASSSSAANNSSFVVQEEQTGFCSIDGSIDNNNSGFTGTGFANTDNAQGNAVKWAINASNSSRYTLTFRFANGGTGNRNGSLLINGGSNGNFTFELPTTGSWTSWKTASIEVDLVQGNNLVQLSALTGEGLPNIDSLTITGQQTSGGTCGTSASSTPTSSSASSKSSSSVPAPQGKFIGNITTSGAVRADFNKYWNQITPENEAKWGSVERSRDVYDWSGTDRVYAYARQHKIPVKAHTFVWGSQFPSWINSLSATDQAAEIEEWIRDYCARYPDTAMIDVVNEAIPSHAPANYAQNAFGNNWIIRSFQLARKYCPNAILILNDYNVLSWDTDKFISLAKPVIAAGVVDAVGLQAHGLESRSLTDLTGKLNQIAALGVPIYISEYDIAKTNDQDQLRIMQEQFPLFYKHSSVKGITLWGYVAGKTWRDGTGLIQDNGTPRPAMTWLMNYLGK
jgi:endo-1,4-beta-xylanase